MNNDSYTAEMFENVRFFGAIPKDIKNKNWSEATIVMVNHNLLVTDK